jgi:serine/threonine-protein kinase
MRLLPDAGSFPALTADGRTLAFTYYSGGSRGHLALRRLDDAELRFVPGSDGATGGPSFSPDGKSLVFSADGKLYKSLVAGGPPTQIGRANWAHTAWAGNDAIIYTFDYDDGLRRVSADGRDSARLTRPDRKRGELGHWWPQTLPDGDHILFSNYTTPADRSRLEVLSLKSGKRDVVLEGAYFGRYVKGQLLFVRGESVLRVPFDVKRLKATGSPVPVGLDANINPTNGTGGFSVSPNGTLAYLRKGSDQIEVVWIDDKGNEQPALDSAGRMSYVEASPDGRKIALVRDGDVWTYDIQRRIYTRLTRSEQQERDLIWTPDSRDLLYIRDVPQFDVFRRPADASRPEELVLTSSRDKSPSSVSPDGHTLLYDFYDPGSEDDIWAVSLVRGGVSTPARIIGGPGRQINARFSPDGKWIVYVSNESGRSETYIAPYPVDRGPARVQVSVNGGEAPVWARDGRSIYYWSNGRLIRVSVNPEQGDIGTAQPLPRIDRLQGWSLAPDGRLLIRRTPENAAAQSLNVILNWASTLEH